MVTAIIITTAGTTDTDKATKATVFQTDTATAPLTDTAIITSITATE